jgi:peptidoglycan/LPS O-acetylase OafA/YrhL
MFLLGVGIQRNFERLTPFLVGRGMPWLLTYVTLVMIARRVGGVTDTAAPNPITMAVLACAVIAGAYSAPQLSRRLLRGNDVSYGVYIYHMVVVNVLVELAAPGTVAVLLAVVVATCSIAWLSWMWVERPALRRKRDPLHAVGHEAGPLDSSSEVVPASQ